MAAISWKTGAPGDWSTPTDWSTNAIPGAADDATINAANAHIVTVAAAEAAHSLTLNAAGGTLEVENRLNIGTTLAAAAGTLQIDAAGTLNGGTVVTGGAGFVFAGGTLSGVTWEGPMVFGGTNASVTATDGLTLTGTGGSGPGALALTGTNAVFSVVGGFKCQRHARYARHDRRHRARRRNAHVRHHDAGQCHADDRQRRRSGRGRCRQRCNGQRLDTHVRGRALPRRRRHRHGERLLAVLLAHVQCGEQPRHDDRRRYRHDAAGAARPAYSGDMMFTNNGPIAATNGGTLYGPARQFRRYRHHLGRRSSVATGRRGPLRNRRGGRHRGGRHGVFARPLTASRERSRRPARARSNWTAPAP